MSRVLSVIVAAGAALLAASACQACPAQAAVGCGVAVAQPQFAVAAPAYVVQQQFAVQAYAAPQFLPAVQAYPVQPQFAVQAAVAQPAVVVAAPKRRGRSVSVQRSVLRVR